MEEPTEPRPPRPPTEPLKPRGPAIDTGPPPPRKPPAEKKSSVWPQVLTAALVGGLAGLIVLGLLSGGSPEEEVAVSPKTSKAVKGLSPSEKVDSLLVSGLLANGDEMNNKPAVVDAPVGKGHVILFGIRPLWRWESQGSFALALNAIANWNHLDF